MMLNQPRFDARTLLDTLVEQRVTSFFAPPTVWRMLLQEDLSSWPVVVREAVAAGETLNAEVVEQVRKAWGLTVRDGWGQSELTVQIANPPSPPDPVREPTRSEAAQMPDWRLNLPREPYDLRIAIESEDAC